VGVAESRPIEGEPAVPVPVILEMATVIRCAPVAGGSKIRVLVHQSRSDTARRHMLDVAARVGNLRLAVTTQHVLLIAETVSHIAVALSARKRGPRLAPWLCRETHWRICGASYGPHYLPSFFS
jgi:hypothetical protein